MILLQFSIYFILLYSFFRFKKNYCYYFKMLRIIIRKKKKSKFIIQQILNLINTYVNITFRLLLFSTTIFFFFFFFLHILLF